MLIIINLAYEEEDLLIDSEVCSALSRWGLVPIELVSSQAKWPADLLTARMLYLLYMSCSTFWTGIQPKRNGSTGKKTFGVKYKLQKRI